MDDPRPYGLWTRKHIAADPRVALTPGSLAFGLNAGEYPPLEHDLIAGGAKLYSDATVERWIAALQEWRGKRGEREAAKRAEAEQRHQVALDAEMERYRVSKLIGEVAQQAYDADAAEVAAINRPDGPFRM
ncbi:hypothetical protein J7E49_21460 [Variovorax paradoxus]|nr:hypothetical protein [Variovorax paradoxus]